MKEILDFEEILKREIMRLPVEREFYIGMKFKKFFQTVGLFLFITVLNQGPSASDGNPPRFCP
jgi:hypothetical protein